jgi:hypothetical protein
MPPGGRTRTHHSQLHLCTQHLHRRAPPACAGTCPLGLQHRPHRGRRDHNNYLFIASGALLFTSLPPLFCLPLSLATVQGVACLQKVWYGAGLNCKDRMGATYQGRLALVKGRASLCRHLT